MWCSNTWILFDIIWYWFLIARIGFLWMLSLTAMCAFLWLLFHFSHLTYLCIITKNNFLNSVNLLFTWALSIQFSSYFSINVMLFDLWNANYVPNFRTRIIFQALAWSVDDSPCPRYRPCKSRKKGLAQAMKSTP